MEWSASRDHESDPTAQDILHSAEYDSVIELMLQSAVLHVTPYFGLNSMVNYRLDYIWSLLYLFLYLGVDLGKESWERSKNRWFEHFHVFNQIFDVTAGISDSKAKHDGVDVHDLLVDMCQRHIREINVVCCEVES